MSAEESGPVDGHLRLEPGGDTEGVGELPQLLAVVGHAALDDSLDGLVHELHESTPAQRITCIRDSNWTKRCS